MYSTCTTTAGTADPHRFPNNSQFKCYDGMHNWNQLQPAPYDGMYQFPSVTGMDPATGKPTGTNCTICMPTDPDTTDSYRHGSPMLPAGKYVVEVVVPPGYELVKEEDKNILIGDNFIAPVTQEFPGLGQPSSFFPTRPKSAAAYNANNRPEPDHRPGQDQPLPSHEGDTGSVETFWPCVGESRIVPDFISLFPQSQEVAPFAGATRNLCDRKEVTLDDQTSALAKFYVFTSTHAAAHFTGVITDDFTSEFDPFSPQFGEKFCAAEPADLHQGLDWNRNLARLYRPMGRLQRPDLLDLGSESAEPDGLFAHDDGHLHERPGHWTDARIRCSTRSTASSATRFRSCPGKPSTWIRRSCPRPPSRRGL